MAKNYKLTEEIKQFILQHKQADPKLSCRGLEALIREHFHVDLSKSLINNVIKESNLSSPIGRRRIKEAITPKKEIITSLEKAATPAKEVPLPVKFSPQSFEVKMVRQEADFMENGGFFFLKAADLKLGLTLRLAEVLSDYFPGLSRQNHQAIIEALIYTPYFKNKKSLWLLLRAEIPEENITQYSQQFLMLPLPQLVELANKAGISSKFNDINGLWHEALLRLSSYIVHSFPPEYQFLDFKAMLERFYYLPGRLERKSGLLIIQLFYPANFHWISDIIWQDGFSSTANRVNGAEILTPEKEQIWISPQVRFS